MQNKVVVIGFGNVGTSYVFSLLFEASKVDEVVIIDTNKEKAEGEVMDLEHCLFLSKSKIKIRVGEYHDVSDAKIVIITAGFRQKANESRIALKDKNTEIVKNITRDVMKEGFKGIFIIATNPVDLMSKVVFKEANIEASKVIGTGTYLDTIRLRYLISEKLNVDIENIHAYVLGEHGDTSFIPYNNIKIGPLSIKNFLNYKELKEIDKKVKSLAYDIIKKKGFTNFGIGVCLVKITKAILENSNTVATVSCYNKENDIFISQLAIINKNGIQKIFKLELNKKDQELLNKSINFLKNE